MTAFGGFPNTAGENSRRAKLTQAQVDALRAAFVERGTMSLEQFKKHWSEKLGVAESTIRNILRRRTWK